MNYNIHPYTKTGKFHKRNEDSYFICDDYLVIADGMGGECDGDIASRIAVESIVSVLDGNITTISSEYDIKEISIKAIRTADSKIAEYVDEHTNSFGMGTTVLLAIKKDNILYLSWCGDSRCFTYKNGKLSSITKDHSYVQQLIDSGNITVEESFSHPKNNVITRFVGGGRGVCIPDFCTHRIEDSEIIILCSDGLSGYCRQNDIAKEIKKNSVLKHLPKQLGEFAVRHGSDDDITIIVLVNDTYQHSLHSDSVTAWIKKLMHL